MSGCANCLNGYVTVIEDAAVVVVPCSRCCPELPEFLPPYDDTLYRCEHGQTDACAICDEAAKRLETYRDYLTGVLP